MPRMNLHRLTFLFVSAVFGATPLLPNKYNTTMSGEWDLKICCMGAGYVGGPTMAVIAKQCPKVRPTPTIGHCCPSSIFIWGNK